MLRKKRRWPVIVGLIAAFLIIAIALDLFIMSQRRQGSIELPAEFPSREMMAHIAANLDQFSEPNGPFTRSEPFGIIALDYATDSGLTIMIYLDSGATPEDVLAAEPHWQGKYVSFSDLLARLLDSGTYLLSFVCTQGPMTMIITQEDAACLTTAPLEEAIALIQSVIGTP